MKSKELDSVDQQILNLLIENARTSIIEIAEQVGLSRVAVKNRIDALEKSGVIEQYTVVLDPEKIGDAVRPKGSIHAFLELHIEQGQVLESGGQDVGVVRTIVGTLVMVGKGQRDADWVGEVLEACDRRVAGENAPAQGLVFWRVIY